jgi:hypothetical protein
LGRSSLAGISGKTPPVKVIFNVNVVLDVYATERTRLRKAVFPLDSKVGIPTLKV